MSTVAIHSIVLETPHVEAPSGHKAVRWLVLALLAYAVLPFAGVGLYENGSGQSLFSLWYLIGFMLLGFFLMHELITPFPSAQHDAG